MCTFIKTQMWNVCYRKKFTFGLLVNSLRSMLPDSFITEIKTKCVSWWQSKGDAADYLYGRLKTLITCWTLLQFLSQTCFISLFHMQHVNHFTWTPQNKQSTKSQTLWHLCKVFILICITKLWFMSFALRLGTERSSTALNAHSD